MHLNHGGPEKEETVPLIQSDDVLLSLTYIRQNALESIGQLHIEECDVGQFYATIPGVLFEKGNGSWSDRAPYNFDTSIQAQYDYFERLMTTRKIKKGHQKFHWNKVEQRFIEGTIV